VGCDVEYLVAKSLVSKWLSLPESGFRACEMRAKWRKKRMRRLKRKRRKMRARSK
jgi:large subunit ribosomal protein L41e